MKKTDKSRLILTVAILLILVACKGPDKKEAPTETTDTTQTATAESTGQDAVMDAVKAAPDLYKILNDTMGILRSGLRWSVHFYQYHFNGCLAGIFHAMYFSRPYQDGARLHRILPFSPVFSIKRYRASLYRINGIVGMGM